MVASKSAGFQPAEVEPLVSIEIGKFVVAQNPDAEEGGIQICKITTPDFYSAGDDAV